MKSILFLLLMFVATASFCQDNNIPASYSSSAKSKLVRYVGYDVNTVMNYLNLYLQNDMQFASMDKEGHAKNGVLTLVYAPQIASGNEIPKRLYVHIKTDKEFKISSMWIDGYWEYVITLFVNYWPTMLDFAAAKKQETVVEHLIDERIALQLTPGKHYGIIRITK